MTSLTELERRLCEANGCQWDPDPTSDSRARWKRDVDLVASGLLAALESPTPEITSKIWRGLRNHLYITLAIDDIKFVLKAAGAHIKQQK